MESLQQKPGKERKIMITFDAFGMDQLLVNMNAIVMDHVKAYRVDFYGNDCGLIYKAFDFNRDGYSISDAPNYFFWLVRSHGTNLFLPGYFHENLNLYMDVRREMGSSDEYHLFRIDVKDGHQFTATELPLEHIKELEEFFENHSETTVAI